MVFIENLVESRLLLPNCLRIVSEVKVVEKVNSPVEEYLDA